MIDFLELPDFLDRPGCEAMRAELVGLAGEAAALLGGDVRSGVRRTTRIAVPATTAARITPLLAAAMPALEGRFGVALTQFEPPQFLRYEAGDFFVAHQDGNTPLIHDDSRFRKVSVVLFLSPHSQEPAPGAHGGGELVLHGAYSEFDQRLRFAPPPGTLVAFRAETTHEVTPVTHGERFTVVTWYR